MRLHSKLPALWFAVVLLVAIQPRLGAGQDWLDRFVAALDSSSAPAQRLASLGPDATPREKIEILARYFRETARTRPYWTISPPEGKPDLAKADRAVSHIIEEYGTQQFGDTLPWFDPDKKIITLARFPHFDPLIQGYVATGDEKYARAVARDLQDFLQHVPISKADDHTVYGPVAPNPWHWVLLHWRVLRWIDALHYLCDSPSLSDELYLRTILQIWDEVDWLLPRADLGLHNSTLGNLRAIYAALSSFPDARNAQQWQEFANRTFECFLRNAFYPGGVSTELTLGYSAAMLSHCLSLALRVPAGVLPKRLLGLLEEITEAHVGLMKPDRSLPRYGDHGLYDIRDWILTKASKLFGREDWATLALEEEDGPLPPYTSFPPRSEQPYRSGYYVMRDGWSRTSQYLAIDAGPFGTNHQHADRLSICVSADGADFIVDPGTATYRSTKPNTRRFDLRFGYLHNVICIDGIDPARGWMRDYLPSPLQNRWVTNDRYDYLEASYHFQPNGLDIAWRRAVFYVRGEYWLLLDWLAGSGKHRVESNLQCAIGSEVRISSPSAEVRAENGARLLVLPANDLLRPKVVIGDTTPRPTTYPLGTPSVDWRWGGRGWVGTFGNESRLDPAQCYPAPAIVRSGTVGLPAIDVLALLPRRSGDLKSAEVRELFNNGDSVAVLVRTSVRGQEFRDLFSWRGTHEREMYGYFPSGSGFWFRIAGGRPQRLAVIRTNHATAELDGWEVECTFSGAFEGYLEPSGPGWSLYVDLASSGKIKLLNLVIRDPQGNERKYVPGVQGEVMGPAGRPTNYLKPGTRYTISLR